MPFLGFIQFPINIKLHVYFLKLTLIFLKYVFSCFLKNGYFGNFDRIFIQGERERERHYIIFYNILDIPLFFFISFVDSEKKKKY